MSPSPCRSTRGPMSLYLLGKRSWKTWGGSITWSSTLITFGRAAVTGATVVPESDGSSYSGPQPGDGVAEGLVERPGYDAQLLAGSRVVGAGVEGEHPQALTGER